ncbi:hypothetical protein ACH4TQ_41485 [Streptomyces sp. NPDC021218]|uniref:hypothetical protein n=1 Tax=unclassified Streptomyces TaxID=2593676 RepID=UPI0036CFD37E
MTSSFTCGYGMAADTGEGPAIQRTMVVTPRSSANAKRHSKALFLATEVQVTGPAGAGGAGRPSAARARSMLVEAWIQGQMTTRPRTRRFSTAR